MNIKNLQPRQKIIIALTAFFLLVLLIIILFINQGSKYGNGIAINNYNKYIPNLPDDRKNSINSTLYNIVKTNLKTSDIKVSDANIRDGSVKYNYDSNTNISSGSFIVDMPSIKQSYFISYEWSNDSNNSNLSGYSSAAACLTADKLIYGEFNCEDDFSKSKNNTNQDPILSHLPYSTFNYTITANIDNNNKVGLDVNIILYLSDTRNGNRESSINRYKTEINEWIKSINLTPDNYSINYTISG
jgi:hypothetical protein